MRYIDENQIPHFFCILFTFEGVNKYSKKIGFFKQKNAIKICN